MDINQTPKRIHPLVAGAAASVMLVSLVGTAAITGILPSSHSTIAPPVGVPAITTSATAPVATASGGYRVPQPVVHHRHVYHEVTAQAQPVEYAPAHQAPVYQQPAAVSSHNSPVGIGIGAVVGGLLGSQIGGGNGRTLATIAGAVGGGYVGNEIAKRNQ